MMSARGKTPNAGPPKAGKGGQKPSTLNPEARQAIGKRLRALYDQVADEPVPDRFADLLQQLEAADRKTSES